MTPKHRFVILCQYFLNGYNPQPDNYPACLDCILALPDEYVPDSPGLRYFAHAFTREVTSLERLKSKYVLKAHPEGSSGSGFNQRHVDWLISYFTQFVPGHLIEEE